MMARRGRKSARLSSGVRPHSMSLPPEIFQQIADAICRPIGSFAFEYESPDAFLDNKKGGIILEIPSGGHYFRLDRTEERLLRFFHSSPGTGTRVATIDLNELPPFNRAFLAFTWSPEETNFHCGPRGLDVGLLHATGSPSPISFRLGDDGSVFQIGDAGVQVMGVRVRRNGSLILAPTAIETWNSTIKAIDLLWTGQSDQGFLFEVLQTNSSLAMLVTGLESYASTRLLEIEKEGIPPEAKKLFDAFSSRLVRQSGQYEELQEKAAKTGQSILCSVLDNVKINFQDFDNLKRAFNATYGIKIGDIGIDSNSIAELRRFIGYRHRIVHVSPLLGMLNESDVPPADPVFANRELSTRAIKIFSLVVDTLHKATTALRPPDTAV